MKCMRIAGSVHGKEFVSLYYDLGLIAGTRGDSIMASEIGLQVVTLKLLSCHSYEMPSANVKTQMSCRASATGLCGK